MSEDDSTIPATTADPLANKVFVIYYNQTITGSVELRAYNQEVVSKCYPKPEKLEEGSPLHYYSKYDLTPGAGKANEPFYDAFLVHMATLDASKYEEYGLVDIDYYEEQYTSVPKNKGKESLFRKTFAPLGENNPRKRDDLGYERAKHIFLLCPTAEYMVQDIIELINENSSSPIIIHIQGDIKNMAKDDNTESVNTTINQRCAMNTHGGMFRDAFNLYSGGEDHRLLREALHNRHAIFLSASPKFDESKASEGLRDLRFLKEQKLYYVRLRDKDATEPEAAANAANTPLYYRKANNDILMLSTATEAEQASVYEKLTNNNTFVDVTNKEQATDNLKKTNILKVYQDGTDKDNLAGLILLGAASGGTKIPIDFIGLRIYISSTVPFSSKQDTFSFSDGGTMRKTEEFFQPGDKDPNEGNIEYQPEFTSKFYTAQLKGFKECLNMSTSGIFRFNDDPERLKRRPLDDDYIVDGTEKTSKSLRAPFNMSLFFWAPKTYMEQAIRTATESTNYNEAMSKIKGVGRRTSDVGGGKRKRRTRKNKKYNKKSKKHHKKRSYKKQHKKTHHKRRTHKRR